PEKPLASLELLISEKGNGQFTRPDGEVKKVESANLANVDAAVINWKDRGDKSRDNLMVFYFCGHGVASGDITTLLLHDFGKREDRPLKQAIDFGGFHLGMDKCAARQQCYFVDTCRVASPTLIEASNYAGDPIIYGSAKHSTKGKRYAPVYYSTVAGSRAYGREGAPSIFTEVLLRAMKGAGSGRIRGDWHVTTNTLANGISYLLEWEIREDEPVEQVPETGKVARFPLHYLKGKPVVPVRIGCVPSKANDEARLSYSDVDVPGGIVTRKDMDPMDWEVDIEPGRYRFSAEFPGGAYRDNNEEGLVWPPIIEVPIGVKL
ncbi:MAG: hypothetical protein JSW52_00335, partial [Candidatus Coatesbacteria bacterium]